MSAITRDFGGKERVFSFGLGFLGDLFEETNFTISNLDNMLAENPFRNIPLFVYHSLLFDVLRKNERPDFDIYTVTTWIEDKGGLTSEFIKDFFSEFNKSFTKNVPVQEENKTDSKKK